MKCGICGKKIEITFLQKIVGTIVKDAMGKTHYACPGCQRRFAKKEDLLKELK